METQVRLLRKSKKFFRDRSKFTGYIGRVLGKICLKKSSSPLFFLIKSLRPLYLVEKDGKTSNKCSRLLGRVFNPPLLELQMFTLLGLAFILYTLSLCKQPDFWTGELNFSIIIATWLATLEPQIGNSQQRWSSFRKCLATFVDFA